MNDLTERNINKRNKLTKQRRKSKVRKLCITQGFTLRVKLGQFCWIRQGRILERNVAPKKNFSFTSGTRHLSAVMSQTVAPLLYPWILKRNACEGSPSNICYTCIEFDCDLQFRLNFRTAPYFIIHAGHC